MEQNIVWHNATTRGRQKKFKWRFDKANNLIIEDKANNLIIERGRRDDNGHYTIHDEFSVSELQQFLDKLDTDFKDHWIPLANNVERMRNGNEIPGLGSTFYSILHNVKRAQAVSQLAPIFEHHKLFQWQHDGGDRWKILSTNIFSCLQNN